jgi:hypothetical protein
LKIRSKSNHSKFQNYLLVDIFVIFLKARGFLGIITYYILVRHLKMNWYWSVHLNFHVYFKTIIDHFTSKVHYYMFDVYLLNFIMMYILLFKLAMLIQKTIGHINDFIICLWHLNKIYFVKSPIWHKKWTTLTCNYLPNSSHKLGI